MGAVGSAAEGFRLTHREPATSRVNRPPPSCNERTRDPGGDGQRFSSATPPFLQQSRGGGTKDEDGDETDPTQAQDCLYAPRIGSGPVFS